MLKKPDHYAVTTPRLLQEAFGKVVDAVNANTEAVGQLTAIAKANTETICMLLRPTSDEEVPAETIADAIPENAETPSEEVPPETVAEAVPEAEEVTNDGQDATKPELEPSDAAETKENTNETQ